MTNCRSFCNGAVFESDGLGPSLGVDAIRGSSVHCSFLFSERFSWSTPLFVSAQKQTCIS